MGNGIKTFSDVVSELRTQKARVLFVTNWRSLIPANSRWFPGSPGDPGCRECEGLGYVRLDVPIGHPYFGKLIHCDCVVRPAQKSEALRRAEVDALQEPEQEILFD